jgi:hypothetical protein
MSVPLTIQGLAGKLDQVAADQAALREGQGRQAAELGKLEAVMAEGLARIVEIQERQADTYLASTNRQITALVAGQAEQTTKLQEHTALLGELKRGQEEQTRLLGELIQLMRAQQGGDQGESNEQ